MNRIPTPGSGMLGRRSALIALTAAVAVSGMAGSLLAAGPKIKSRIAAPAAHVRNQGALPSQAIAGGPIQNPGDSIPSWFPPGPGSATEVDDLRKLLRKHGDRDGNGCISRDEAYLLYHSIRRDSSLYKGTFRDWLRGKGYLRDNPARLQDILDRIWRDFGTSHSYMDLEGFIRLLQSLGLMCSAAPSAPIGGGSGGGVMLPELPY